MWKSVRWAVVAVLLIGGLPAVALGAAGETAKRDLASMTSVGLPERRELVALAKKEQFDHLNRIMAGLQGRYEKGRISEYVVSNAFGAFARVDPELAAPLKRWRKHSPKFFAPFLASGVYNVHLAWAVRGAEWSRLTSRPQMKAMTGYLEEGGKKLRAAVEKTPRLPAAWSELIRIAMATRTDPTLGLVYQEALRHAPRSPSVHRAYHFALQRKWGGNARQQAALRASLRKKFGGDERFRWVSTYEREREMEQVLEQDVSSVSAFGRERQIKQVQAERDAAKRAAKKNTETALKMIDALLAERKTAWLYKHRGIALRRLERFEEAVNAYKHALNLAPAWTSLYEGMIQTQGRLHRPREAQRYWKLVLELDPYDPDLLVGYAGFLSGILKQKEEANAVIQKALVYGEHDDELRIAIAIHYWESRMPERALEETTRAVELVPRRPMNWFYHGLALERTEDCEAIKAYKRYLRLCTEGACMSQKDRMQRSVRRLTDACS